MTNDFYVQQLTTINKKRGASHLLIVSKKRTVEEIRIYYDLGHRDFGENRVSELQEKASALAQVCPEIRWHMIGHLQSNKLKTLLKISHLYAIHSVDRWSILEKLWQYSDDILAQRNSKQQKVKIFLQVNTSHEKEKSGFLTKEDVLRVCEFILNRPNHLFQLSGLMTMGTLRTVDFIGEADRCFKKLSDLKNELSLQLNVDLETSMGMSQDYDIAVKHCSNWIRLGSIMFPNG